MIVVMKVDKKIGKVVGTPLFPEITTKGNKIEQKATANGRATYFASLANSAHKNKPVCFLYHINF